MQFILNSNPGYNISEYLLVLRPTGKTCQQIWSFKRDFDRTFHAETATRTRPHLSLVYFSAYQKNEERIANCLQTIAMGVRPFYVTLENFGCYAWSRTIFINVVTRGSVRSVVNEMKQAKHLLKLKARVLPKYMNDPHVSICREMELLHFKAGWKLYSGLSYSGSFIANNMTLLKQNHTNKKCEVVASFPFQSTPMLPKQGDLFS